MAHNWAVRPVDVDLGQKNSIKVEYNDEVKIDGKLMADIRVTLLTTDPFWVDVQLALCALQGSYEIKDGKLRVKVPAEADISRSKFLYDFINAIRVQISSFNNTLRGQLQQLGYI